MSARPLDWDRWIKEAVDRAPPLQPWQIAKIRAIFASVTPSPAVKSERKPAMRPPSERDATPTGEDYTELSDLQPWLLVPVGEANQLDYVVAADRRRALDEQPDH